MQMNSSHFTRLGHPLLVDFLSFELAIESDAMNGPFWKEKQFFYDDHI